METEAKKVYDFLNALGVEYQVIEHPPVYTCDELEQYMDGVKGGAL